MAPEIHPWARLKVIQEHMDDLVARGLIPTRMSALEWHVPGNEKSPVPPEGYTVSFVPFHERGFCSPPHRFLRGLLHHYGIEL
ncbi:unnamed protein product [Urochloa humidicola]